MDAWNIPRKFLRISEPIFPRTNIFEREWELCIILDACRLDLMKTVGPEFDFIRPNNINYIWSVESNSLEWMQQTFRDLPNEELEATAYVSGNVWTENAFTDCRPPEILDEVWDYAWNHERGFMPPRPITDRAIDIGRNKSIDRLLVHYMQPHVPLVAGDFEAPERKPEEGNWLKTHPSDADPDEWEQVSRGELDFEQAIQAYRDNLRFVLKDIELLIQNVDAEMTVISADHGNCLGDWGKWGHPAGLPHPAIRKVPWVEVTASDEMTRQPAEYIKSGQGTVEERLEALGYR
jgi:hypothetical protein